MVDEQPDQRLGILEPLGEQLALDALGGDVSAKDKAFYEGKVAAAQFFARTQLPKLTAERAIAEATDLSLMDLDEAAF